MKFVPTSITRNVSRKLLTTKMNSPHIFFAAGVVGIVGATVLACRATLKLEETVDEINKDIDKVKSQDEAFRNPEIAEQIRYQNLGKVYLKSAVKVGRLYGPAIVVGGVSVACLTGSHVQLTRRNAALSMTLAAAMKAYEQYRVRVAEELGTEKELELYRAIHDDVIEMDGHKKEIVKVTDPNGWSPYARIFDESNRNWKKNSEYNRLFIQCQQNQFNHQLQVRGHVFLNEVYDALGFERSRAGAVVGWTLEDDWASNGDGYIDFGLFEARSTRFMNQLERSIVLDFNVDGVIQDKIKE